MGASGIETIDMQRLWDSMRTGNKGADAFSELCFDDAERWGVGLSRLAEVMVLTIERLLECEHYAAFLKPELWVSVKMTSNVAVGFSWWRLPCWPCAGQGSSSSCTTRFAWQGKIDRCCC